MPVVVKGKISRNAGNHFGQVHVQRYEGATADGDWTADTHCVTADGRIICIPATVAEPANAVEAFDAIVIAGGAVVDADMVEAAAASDLADAVSEVAADAIEPASALDALDAVADIAAAVDEPAAALDETDAAIGAQILSGTVDEAAAALDVLDADVISVEVPIAVGGGSHYPRRRPLPVYGAGYGVLPRLEGEAHGVVGAVGKSAAQILVGASAIGASGQVGNAAATLKGLTVASKGAVGARGRGEGVIVKFSGSATGRHDDDEAAVIAFLLAA
jgi:hypothetical protein